MADRWIDLGQEISTRGGAAMAYHPPSGKLVLFGGLDESLVQLDETLTWDGSVWTLESPASAPPACEHPGMAYHAATEKLVLFTGVPSFPQATWTWDGSNWTEESPSTSPVPDLEELREFSMAAHPDSGTVVLFGGLRLADGGATQELVDNTWTWDGSDWTLESPASNPSARYRSAFCYFSPDNVALLFGGTIDNTAPSENGSQNDETWTWDGANWTQESPATVPFPRMFAPMTERVGFGTAFMFGGYVADDEGSAPGGPVDDYSDTWTWNGTDWTELLPTTSPSVGAGSSMGFDETTGQLILVDALVSATWMWGELGSETGRRIRFSFGVA